MALVNMTRIMDRAKEKGRGAGAFCIYNLAMLRGVMQAAEALKTPVILMVAEKRFGTAPLEYVGPMMLSAARNASVDVAVHLDHGESLEAVQRALEMGFPSVMYDGSSLPFEENVKNTLRVMEMARPYKADVEAELGCMAKKEDGSATAGEIYTRPEEAAAFIKQTGVNALALAIGNQHGNYTSEPKLQFEILRQIHEENPGQHLVLHGGSGISDTDFQKCIRSGITKINVGTAMLNAIMHQVDEQAAGKTRLDYYPFYEKVVEEIRKVAEHHMRVFSMETV